MAENINLPNYNNTTEQNFKLIFLAMKTIFQAGFLRPNKHTVNYYKHVPVDVEFLY